MEEALPEPEGVTGLLFLGSLLTSNQPEGPGSQTGCSQSQDKRHVERKPATQQGLQGPPLGATDP